MSNFDLTVAKDSAKTEIQTLVKTLTSAQSKGEMTSTDCQALLTELSDILLKGVQTSKNLHSIACDQIISNSRNSFAESYSNRVFYRNKKW